MATQAALDIRLGVEEQHKDITLSIGKNTKNITLKVDRGSSYLPEYDGPYRVYPTFYYDQILITNGKKMADNVTVASIPIEFIQNEYGGQTVIIG